MQRRRFVENRQRDTHQSKARFRIRAHRLQPRPAILPGDGYSCRGIDEAVLVKARLEERERLPVGEPALLDAPREQHHLAAGNVQRIARRQRTRHDVTGERRLAAAPRPRCRDGAVPRVVHRGQKSTLEGLESHHPLHRTVPYTNPPPSERRRCHRRAGQVIALEPSKPRAATIERRQVGFEARPPRNRLARRPVALRLAGRGLGFRPVLVLGYRTSDTPIAPASVNWFAHSPRSVSSARESVSPSPYPTPTCGDT